MTISHILKRVPRKKAKFVAVCYQLTLTEHIFISYTLRSAKRKLRKLLYTPAMAYLVGSTSVRKLNFKHYPYLSKRFQIEKKSKFSIFTTPLCLRNHKKNTRVGNFPVIRIFNFLIHTLHLRRWWGFQKRGGYEEEE